ncbi:hypothetical protein D3C77_648530 [compost metagenome]
MALALGGQLFVEEDGVVDAHAQVGLEGGVAVQRIDHGAEGRRQVGDFAQFAIQAGNTGERAHALDTHIVSERRGSQQLDTNLVGEHVGEVQA